MSDARYEGKKFFDPKIYSAIRTFTLISGCLVLAAFVSLYPTHEGLEEGARWMLFILVFASGLWITEAIPAFSVSLLIIGLEITILGHPGGVFATASGQWKMFIEPWGSPLIWLFFGGFALAASATKTGLDRWLALHSLQRFGSSHGAVLFASMGMTFLFSMFMSNTATAAMMVAVMMPVIATLDRSDPYIKALLLGVAFSANLGGMGTLIGSPPNAIAAGALSHAGFEPISFFLWMKIAVPPALLLFLLSWVYLYFKYPAKSKSLDLSLLKKTDVNRSPLWHKISVMVIFVGTIGFWLTSSIHGVPTTVISILPICALTATGILNAEDIQSLPWNVLLLITGGLSLGVGIQATGLAPWLVQLMPLDTMSLFTMLLAVSFLTLLMSNLMSNTATTNILVPIGIAIAVGNEYLLVVTIALSASTAMCFPISTPPNAIVYGTNKITTKELLVGGLILGSISPFLITYWINFIMPKIF